MNCDICGIQISGLGFKVRVEGAKLLVCSNCRSLGKPYREERVATRPILVARRAIERRTQVRKPPGLSKQMEDLEVAEDFAQLVRQKRMKLGLSQEELARRVKEKISVIQKVETGKMTPDMKLCRELEHELKVKLVVPQKDVSELPKIVRPAQVTLGDIVRVKGKPGQ